MSFHNIQEAINTKTAIVSALAVAGTGNTIHLWLEAIADPLIVAVQISSILMAMSIFIINIPKMFRVLNFPFRRDKKPDDDGKEP